MPAFRAALSMISPTKAVLSVLRATVQGNPLGMLGEPFQAVAALGERLLRSRYVAIVHDAAVVTYDRDRCTGMMCTNECFKIYRTIRFDLALSFRRCIPLHVLAPAFECTDVNHLVDSLGVFRRNVPAVEVLEFFPEPVPEPAAIRNVLVDQPLIGKQPAAGIHCRTAFHAPAPEAVAVHDYMFFQVAVVELEVGQSTDAPDHPVQRQVGKRGIRIGAADVGVHAGKPDLLHDLSGRGGLSLLAYP